MRGLEWASALETRAANLMSGGVEPGLVSRAAEETSAPGGATSDFINQLQFSAAKSIRTSIITLASFNVLAATVTLACILWDSYSGAKRKDPSVTLRDIRPSFVTSPLVYPLVLSLGIMVQGIIFASAQARGLGALLVEGCVQVSQMMMPATFLVPFIQLIFGIETTLRAFAQQPFPARRKWVAPLGVAIAIAGLVALYAVTLKLRPPERCFASLFWFTQAWRPVCFGLLVAITFTLLLCLFVVFFRLRHGKVTSTVERTSASHMVYYIAVAVISNALLTPFFFSITFSNQDDSAETPMELSTVSSIVANISGLLTGGLYLFLRSRNNPPGSSCKRETFYFDAKPCILAEEKHTSYYTEEDSPTQRQRYSRTSVYSQSNASEHPFSRDFDQGEFRRSMDGAVPQRGDSVGTNTLPVWMQGQNNTTPAGASSIRGSIASRISSFSFFKPRSPRPETPSAGLLPATTYTPMAARLSASSPETILMPPPLFHAQEGSGHNRKSSIGSARTVKIGLRISNMNDVQPMRPSQLQSPRQTRTTGSVVSTGAAGPSALSWVTNQSNHSEQSNRGTVELNKQLPKSPPVSPAHTDGGKGDLVQLNPTVYSPQKAPPRAKLASPRGVGFQTAPVDRTPRRDRQRSATVNAATEKGGWI